MGTVQARAENVGTSARIFALAAVAALLLVALLPGMSRAAHAAATPTATVTAAAAAPANPVGMWVWQWDDPNSVVSFARTHNVNLIHLYAHPGFTKDPATYSKVSQTAKLAKMYGIAVYALGGDPSWVLNPEAGALWADEIVASKLFTGMNVGVEPQQYPDWETNKDVYAQQYVTAMLAVKAHKGKMKLDVSLPWWYHMVAVGAGSDLTSETIKLADSITIITYADTVDGVNYDAKPAAQKATLAKKPFRFASETNNSGTLWVDFYTQPATDMYQVQDTVYNMWKTNRYFKGFVVHDYTGWAAMGG